MHENFFAEHTLALTASFQDNLSKLVLECQTILDCAAAKDDDAVAVMMCGTLKSVHTSSQIPTTDILCF